MWQGFVLRAKIIHTGRQDLIKRDTFEIDYAEVVSLVLVTGDVQYDVGIWLKHGCILLKSQSKRGFI